MRIGFTSNPVEANRSTEDEEAKKLREKQELANKLLSEISGQKKYANLSTDDWAKNLKKDLEALHSKSTKDDSKRNLTGFSADEYNMYNNDMYKLTLETLEQQMEAVEKKRKAEAQLLVKQIAADCNETDDRKIRTAVRKSLAEKYEKGEISKEVYESARKYGETKRGTHFFKSVWRGVFGGTKESSEVYKSTGYNNNVNKIRNSENGPQYDAEMTKKLKNAGIDKEIIYKIGDNLVGAEAEVTYSDKRKQAGEAQFIADELNKYARRNGSQERFTAKDARDIMEGAGYHIEKAVDGGKVLRDVAVPGILGAAAGVPMGLVNVDQNQNVNVNYGSGVDSNKVHQDQHAKAVPYAPLVTAAVAAGLAALASIDKQMSRVEDKAIPVQIDCDIETIDDYIEYVKDSNVFPTKQAKEMAIQIAGYYTKDDGTLMKDELLTALRKAGGSNDDECPENNRDASVLNHKEALALLTQLQTGKIKVTKPTPVSPAPVKEKVSVGIQKETFTEVTATDCYKVELGDNWYVVAQGVYNVTNSADLKAIVRQLKDTTFEEMKKAGTLPADVKSSRDGFFPKVGEDLCLPKKITVNGHTYELDVNRKVDHVEYDPNAKYDGVSYNSTGNVFENRKDRQHFTVTASDGNGPIYEGSDEDEAKNAVEDFKKKNAGKEVTVEKQKDLPHRVVVR